MPMGHPQGGDVRECPSAASFLGLAAAEGVSVAPSAGAGEGEGGKKER